MAAEKTLSPNQLGSVGAFGENAAADYVAASGYSILCRNVKFGRHELDLVAEDEKYIVFFEIKTRSVSSFSGINRLGGAARSVTYEKQRNTVEAAREYLKQNKTRKFQRIDVIEVYVEHREDGLAVSSINHIRNAFGQRR